MGNPQANSWQVLVTTAEDDWLANGMRYSSRDAAVRAGNNLMAAWTQAREFKVVPSDYPPNDAPTAPKTEFANTGGGTRG